MSLIKELWLAIASLLFLVLAGSVVVTSLSTRDYLEQQLAIKNTDNANALALSLSQQVTDPVMLELTLSAQFDTGYYELIELISPTGETLIRREDAAAMQNVPAWVAAALPIEAAEGRAEIQQGWQQLGTLRLRSHSRFAYAELWRSMRRLSLLFLLATVIAGALGSYLLRRILMPLNAVIAQAEALEQRRYITIEEPRTREFKHLVSSMNRRSRKIQELLSREASRLDERHRESHTDKPSGLINREQFMKLLDSALDRHGTESSGVIALVRLTGLARMNQIYGRPAVDDTLSALGAALNTLAARQQGWVAARLNGSDLALMAPQLTDPAKVGETAQTAVSGTLKARGMEDATSVPAAAIAFDAARTSSKILASLDAALLASDQRGNDELIVADGTNEKAVSLRQQLRDWQTRLDIALKEDQFYLASKPVLDRDGQTLHRATVLCLGHASGRLTPREFSPWAARLGLAVKLDQRAVQQALSEMRTDACARAVKLSTASLNTWEFSDWLQQVLGQESAAAATLWLEVPESAAFYYLDNFRELSHTVHRCGAKLGIEHLGQELSNIDRLHDIGIDYVKLDVAYTRDIHRHRGNQALLRELCALVHAIDVIVIAESVGSDEGRDTLYSLGVDAIGAPERAAVPA